MKNIELYLQAFVETFPTISLDQMESLKYQSVQEWDSIGHLTLIANLEQAFQISIDMDDIIDLSSYTKGKEILKKYNVVF